MRRLALAALLVLNGAAGFGPPGPGAHQGPSSSQTPYVLPLDPRVAIISIATAGDRGDSQYPLTGFPDGLGAFDNGDGTFELLVNHELPGGAGAVRAHGARGAFISRLTIRKSDLRVVAGEDLIRRVATWNRVFGGYDAPRVGVDLFRFCSGDLPAPEAFFDATSGLGFDGAIYMAGEEVSEGRAFAHLLDGTSYELPRLGRFSIENAVARPAAGEKTVVIGLDDTNPGQLYVYIGTKTAAGSPVARAGLTNGRLYGVKVTGFSAEDLGSGIPSGSAFTLADLGDVTGRSAAELENLSNALGVTRFWRPEDGAWDPGDPRDFYFATTVRPRLWRLRFDDLLRPEAGGHIDMLLTGAEGVAGLDNLTVTRHGEVIVQEDPLDAASLARIWRYVPATGELTALAGHDPARFVPGGASYLTNSEESSGIIDASAILGEGWLLFDVQAHYPLPGALVEGGQVLAMRFPAVAKQRAVRR